MDYQEFLRLPEDNIKSLLRTFKKQEMIRDRTKSFKIQIELINEDIRRLQSECTHPNVSMIHRSDNGNYDPGCDSFWKQYHCPDCDKRWTEGL